MRGGSAEKLERKFQNFRNVKSIGSGLKNG